MENSVRTAHPRRAELKALSAQLKPVAHEFNTSLNAALVFHYAEQTGKQSQDFKTLTKWNEEGYSIKKGETSFIIWAKPEKMTLNVEEGRIGKEAEVVTVYKLIHLFHVGQVFKRKAEKQEPATYAQAQGKTTYKKGKSNKAEA